MTRVTEQQSYPDHPERFDYWPEVLCREGLTGRCYWEVEWEGEVAIGVTYRGITRKGQGDDSLLGWNNKSWRLLCLDAAAAAAAALARLPAAVAAAAAADDDDLYSAWFNGHETLIRLRPSGPNRVGVYVDRPAGTLSFYRVSPDVGGSSDTLTHIHTFQLTSTQEDLLPGFGVYGCGSSVTLCRL